MSNIETPEYVQDAAQLLSDDGFSVGDTWFHGTASGLLASIKESGLNRSGDAASNQAIKSTMATIGNSYTESIEPVFLTQSKELAYFWAQRKATFRSSRLGAEELPVVLAVNLSEELNSKVMPDAGGAGMIIARDSYIEYLEIVYEANGKKLGELDPMTLDGKTAQAKLGLAYIDQNIPAEFITLLVE